MSWNRRRRNFNLGRRNLRTRYQLNDHMTSTLNSAIESYETAIVALEAGMEPSDEQILEALLARDAVKTAMSENVPTGSLIKLKQLDDRLKKKSGYITKKIDLSEWRQILNRTAAAWWWFLEPPTHRWDRLDWLWGGLTVVVLTINIGLAIEISSRFVSSGLDILGTFGVIIPSGLTMLAAGGALTKLGRETIERMLARLRIPKHFWHEVKLGLSVIVSLVLVGMRLSLPKISDVFNKWGVEYYYNGQWSTAMRNYNLAIQLNPDSASAHYNLGTLYEKLQDLDLARTEYRIAVAGEFDRAYNNLGRLYIKNEEYSEAVLLLVQGLDRAKDDVVKYYLHKNLGWARLKQERYHEAEAELRMAIDLDKERAPAHCLLAKVLEAQDKPVQAQSEWEKCLKFSSGREPDEDEWIGEAKKKLRPPGDLR